MRICFFKPNSLREGGGAEHWLIDVSSRLPKNHEVIIAGLNHAWTQRLRNQEILSFLHSYGTKYYELPSVKLPRGFPLPHPMYNNFLLNMLNTCDIVYAVVPFAPVEVWVKLFRRALKTKLIAGFHGFLRTDVLLQKLYFPTLKEAIKVFDSYHALNKSTYAWLRSVVTNKSIFYIPNGIDTKTFQLCRDPSSSQHFNVIFTGRLIEDKGADILIDIIKHINDKLELKNIRFIIVGSGTYEQEIRALAQKYRNVVYLGYVNRQALPKIYMETNLFLLPSRTEGFPISLLEAQSCGLPAVGSKIPGISDVIIERVTGRLIEPGNVKSFAEAIKDYYLLWSQDPAQYYEINKTIRNHIVKHYDWNIIIRHLELMFESIVNQ
ncbi:glycosyltransferase family 4 protein [Thermofilum sp.]|uniref:glycosyltransferase family 4 protein n=1 Tax=Thermofilum sp. TaxID=1961369 RepID=UPI003160A77C